MDRFVTSLGAAARIGGPLAGAIHPALEVQPVPQCLLLLQGLSGTHRGLERNSLYPQTTPYSGPYSGPTPFLVYTSGSAVPQCLLCDTACQAYTHTHTHIYVYIYIYI